MIFCHLICLLRLFALDSTKKGNDEENDTKIGLSDDNMGFLSLVKDFVFRIRNSYKENTFSTKRTTPFATQSPTTIFSILWKIPFLLRKGEVASASAGEPLWGFRPPVRRCALVGVTKHPKRM